MTKDYYRILGVLDDAENIVIRAAYKALAQRYHPDKWGGNKVNANTRMAEINEAYETLSDSEKRKKYDQSRERFKYSDEDTETVARESSDFLDEINRDWSIAKNHFPEIDKNYEELKKFAYPLAFSYKLILLETQEFKENRTIYSRLKESFLKTYFGEDVSVALFAQELILEGQIKAAQELNDHVRVLGRSLISEKVILEISSKFRTNRFIKNKKDEEQIEALRKQNVLDAKARFKDDNKLLLGGTLLFIIIISGYVFGTFETFVFLVISGGVYGGYYFYKENTKNQNTRVILCPQCASKFKVPPGKKLEIRCKTCAHIWRINEK